MTSGGDSERMVGSMHYLPFIVFLWSVVGTILWCSFTVSGTDLYACPALDEDELSWGQFLLIRLLAGPVIWALSICQVVWWVLSFIGRRA